MYGATVPNRSSPPAILLRESYRQDGKVKTQTLANITHWRSQKIDALRAVLQDKSRGRIRHVVLSPDGPVFGQCSWIFISTARKGA